MVYVPTSGFDPDVAAPLLLPPPQPMRVRRRTESTASRNNFRLRFPPISRIPVIGMKPRQNWGANHISTGFSVALVPDGTFTVSVNGTALLLGVIVFGEKVQDAPEGRELGAHESEMGSFGLPVFAFNEMEYVAELPGEIVCGAG